MSWLQRLRPFTSVILLLLLFFAVAFISGAPDEDTPYHPDSHGAGGLRVLSLWLTEMGYDVGETKGAQFEIPDRASLLFVHPGPRGFSEAQAARLSTWVERGGTLVLVHGSPPDRELASRFGVDVKPGGDYSFVASQAQPLLPDAEAEWSVFEAGPTLDIDGAQASPVLRSELGEVTVAVQQVGDGVVWHLTEANSLVNSQLAEEDRALLMPALLRTVPSGARVLFDTFHQIEASHEIATMRDWLYHTPAGWATLFGMVVGGLYLLLQGRRLGPALPSVATSQRREAAEYVRAAATLQRRTRQRAAVAAHHKRRLKRGIGRRYQVSPELSDAEFLQTFQQAERRLGRSETEEVGRIMSALGPNISEGSLVELVDQVDQILDKTW